MNGFMSRLLSFALALCMAATLMGSGAVPVSAQGAPAGEAETAAGAGESGGESVIAEEPGAGGGEEAAPEETPPGDGSESDSSPDAPVNLSFDEIVFAAEADGARAAAMANAFADTETFLAAVRAVLDHYYGSGGHPQLNAFAAALDARGSEVLAAYAEAAAEREQDRDQLGYVPGQVMVVFAEDVSEPKAETVLEGQGASLEGTVEVATEEVVAVADISLEQTVEAAVEAIEADPKVEYAQPVYVYRHAGNEPDGEPVEVTAQGFSAAAEVSPAAAGEQRVAVNDTYANTAYRMYYYMWWAEAVNTFEAWDLLADLEDRETVRVAVLDTAQSYTHPDLQSNVRWDLFRDFSKGRISDEQGVFPTPDLKKGHGTHVTGILAATANNRTGGFGVGAGYDNSIVEVVPVNVFELKNATTGEYGTATIDVIAPAIDYAVAQGAKVINLSLGYQPTSPTALPDQVLKAAVDRAVDAGVTVVGAAGNGNNSNAHYPSDLGNVIGVINVSDRANYTTTGSGEQKTYTSEQYDQPKRWSSSNYARGTEKDISAPGAQVLSTFGDNNYAFNNGTSMSTPVVSAVAAMLLYVRPELTPAQVREILCGTAMDLGDEGYDKQTAWGLVDAEAAVEMALLDPPENLKAVSTGPGSVNLSWDPQDRAAGYTLYRSTEPGRGYAALATVTTSTHTDLTVQPGVMYYYMVASSLDLSSGLVAGAPSAPVAGMAQLATPTDIAASAAGTTAITLTWDTVDGADGYSIYRSAKGPGPFKTYPDGSPEDYEVEQISILSGSTGTYTDRDLDPAQNYYYSVCAQVIRASSATDSSGRVWPGPQLALAQYRRTTLGRASALRLAATGDGGPTLRWNAASGATGYEVYFGTAAHDVNTLLATTKGLSYTDGALAVNAAGYYKVVPVRAPENGPEDDRAPDATDATDVLYVYNHSSAPTGFSARSTGYDTVELAWDAGANVDGYHLYRATAKNGPYALAGIREGAGSTTFADSGLAFSKTYHYRLYHYTVVDGAHSESASYTQTGPVTTALATVTDLAVAQNGDGVLEVRWDTVPGASGYTVYRAAGAGDFAPKAYKSLNAKTTAFTDAALPAGTYRYRVEAWRSASGRKLAGPAAEGAGTATGLAAPANFAARSEADYTATLSWDAVPRAEGYCLYRSIATGTDLAPGGAWTPADSEYTLVKTLAGAASTEWTDASVPAGHYSYKVAAYKTVSRKKTPGAMSAAAITVGGLGAVQSFTAKGQLYGAALSWSAPADATGLAGYTVYRSDLSPQEEGFAKSLKQVKTLAADATGYNEGGLAAGAYTYRVTATVKLGGKKLAGAPVTAQVTAQALAPAGLAAEPGPHNSAVLTWNAAPEGEAVLGYTVYRSALSPSEAGFEKSLKRIKTLTAASLSATGGKYTFKDTPLAAGGYTYRVLPYIKSGGKTITALPAAGATATVRVAALPAPTGLAATSPEAYTVDLSWDAVPGAGGYYVYREGSTKAIKTLNADTLTYTDTKADPGKAAYEVRAFYKPGGKAFPGNAAQTTAPVAVKAGVGYLCAYNAYRSADQGPYNTVSLLWGWLSDPPMPDDVKGYYIYRQAVGEPGMTLIKTLAGKGHGEYQDAAAPEGTYAYYVAPYYRVGGRNLPGELYQAWGNISPTPLPAPKQVDAQPGSGGYLKATVTWEALRSPVDNSLQASGYIIYRSGLDEDDPEFEDSFKPVKTVSGAAKATHTETLTDAGRHWYQVAAYKTVGGKKVEGTRSEAVYLDPATPAGVTLDAFEAEPDGYHTVRLSWKPVRSDEYGSPAGYYIYRSGSANGAYTLAATVKSGGAKAVKVAGLETGTHYFMIAPYFKAGKALLAGASAGPKAATVEHVSFTDAQKAAFAAEGTASLAPCGVELNWTKADGASGYNIYRAETENGAFTLAGSVSAGKTTHKDYPPQAGSYWYKVVPYRTVKGKKLDGEGTAAKPGVCLPLGGLSAAPAATATDVKGQTTVTLSWEAVPGAAGYVVYDGELAGTPGDLLATKKGNAATSHTLKNVQGTAHYYYVRPWYKGGKVTYYGPESPRANPWE